jgi:hypothetical protein
MLKRLRGAPIARHTEAFGMVYDGAPPYQVRQTAVLDAGTVQQLARFARYWDLVANSGRFTAALPLVLANAPFSRFLDFAVWLHAACGQTHALAAERLYELVHRWLLTVGVDAGVATEVLAADYRRSGARGRLALGAGRVLTSDPRPRRRLGTRQSRHLAP